VLLTILTGSGSELGYVVGWRRRRMHCLELGRRSLPREF
jgi:hypothetical protein